MAHGPARAGAGRADVAVRASVAWSRFPLATALLAGWLGGGVVAAAIARVVDGPADLHYAVAHLAAAGLAILLLPALGPVVAGVVRRHSLARPPGAEEHSRPQDVRSAPPRAVGVAVAVAAAVAAVPARRRQRHHQVGQQ